MSKRLAIAVGEDILCPVVFPVTCETETELLKVVRRQGVVTVEVGLSAQEEVCPRDQPPVLVLGAEQHSWDCQEDSVSGEEQEEDCGVRDGVTVWVVCGACQEEEAKVSDQLLKGLATGEVTAGSGAERAVQQLLARQEGSLIRDS
jgi:hypothetical protein